MSYQVNQSSYVPPGIPINSSPSFGVVPNAGGREMAPNTPNKSSPTPIVINPNNPSLLITDLNVLVPGIQSRRGDLICYSKSDKICFVDGNNLRVWENRSVSTLITSPGPIVDVTISPHFDTFVAIVDTQGFSTVQDLTQKQPTFKLIPNSKVAGNRPLLKASWHPSKASTFVTAYEDGLVCIWDLSSATTTPKTVIEGVATYERPEPATNGPFYPEQPKTLVCVRVPEIITDIAVSGDFLLTTSISGTLRIYGLATGELMLSMQDHVPSDSEHGLTGGHGNIVVVSEAPFIFVTGNRLNNYLRVWKSVSTAPLQFALIDHLVFNPLPIPQSHPGHLVPFGMLRQSSMNTIVMFHPALCALWLITIGQNGAERTLTFGSKNPISCLSTPEAAKGFVGISEKMAVIVKFSNVVTENVSIVPQNLNQLEICSNSSMLQTNSNTDNASAPAPVDIQPPAETGIPVETLKLILQKQNQAYLEHFKRQRALTVAKQAHFVKILQELPAAIMATLSPMLSELANKASTNIDINQISNQIANAAKEPAGQAMSMYFTDALIPGYKKACSMISNDVSNAVDTAIASFGQQLAPAHVSKTIDPIVNGLVAASSTMTKTLSECQKMHAMSLLQKSALESNTVTASPSVIESPVVAHSTPTVTPSPSKKVVKAKEEKAPVVQVSTERKKRERAPSLGPATTSSSSIASPLPVQQKPKEVKKPAAPVVQPAKVVEQPKPEPVHAHQDQEPSSSQQSSAPAPHVAEPQPTQQVSQPAQQAPQQPIESLPAVPRPEPVAMPVVPLPDSVRSSIMVCVGQKKIQEAVKVAIDSNNVEAVGFLSSRADLSQSIDFIDQSSLASILTLITSQTAPTSSQLQRYSKLVHLILLHLRVKEIEDIPQLLTTFTVTKSWMSGSATEKEDNTLIDHYLGELFP